MSYTEKLEQLQQEIQSAIESSDRNQVAGNLVILLSALQIVLQGIGGGGSGGGGLSEAQTTAAVKAALETATNLDGAETLLAEISGKFLNSAQTTAAVKVALETATNLDGAETLLAEISGKFLNSAQTTAAVKSALETATNLDGAETLLAEISGKFLNSAQTTAAVKSALETAVNLDTVEGLIAQISTELAKRVNLRQQIQVLRLVNSLQEYSYSIPLGTRKIAFKCRNCTQLSDPAGDVFYAWQGGEIIHPTLLVLNNSGNFDVLPNGSEEFCEVNSTINPNIFFASPTANVALTIRTWIDDDY